MAFIFVFFLVVLIAKGNCKSLDYDDQFGLSFGLGSSQTSYGPGVNGAPLLMDTSSHMRDVVRPFGGQFVSEPFFKNDRNKIHINLNNNDNLPVIRPATNVPHHDNLPVIRPATNVPNQDNLPVIRPATNVPHHDNLPVIRPATNLPQKGSHGHSFLENLYDHFIRKFQFLNPGQERLFTDDSPKVKIEINKKQNSKNDNSDQDSGDFQIDIRKNHDHFDNESKVQINIKKNNNNDNNFELRKLRKDTNNAGKIRTFLAQSLRFRGHNRLRQMRPKITRTTTYKDNLPIIIPATNVH